MSSNTMVDWEAIQDKAMDTESYWNHIEEAFDKINIYEGAEVFLTDFHRYPDWIGDLLAAHWILSEIANGGFTQFFLNSTGVLAPESVVGFTRMGLPTVATLVVEAMLMFGKDYPRNRYERIRILAAKTNHTPDDETWNPFKPDYFEGVEKRLYELGGDDFGRIYDAMDAYAKNHTS